MALVTAAALCGGCGGSQAATPLAHVCDGSNALRLRMYVKAQNDRELRGSIVRVENGYPSFAIDGSCNFWMGSWVPDDPMARDQGWRTGKVSPELRDALDQKLALESLDQLQDCPVDPGSFDGSTRVIQSATSAAYCGSNGTRFDAAWSIIESEWAAAWAAGVPLSAVDLHITAVSTAAPALGMRAPYSWPLDAALSSYLIDEAQAFTSGVSSVISPPDADKLRGLRETYIAERTASPGLFADGMEVTDGTQVALVYLRDALPFEDSNGLLTFSTPP